MTTKRPTVLEALEQDRSHWHFEKRLSIDTLVGIMGVAIVIGGPVLIWGRAMENRVLTLENVKEESIKSDTKKEADLREQRTLVGGRLDKIDDRMNSIQIDVAKLVTSVNSGQIAAAAAVTRSELGAAPAAVRRNGR